MRSVHWVQQDLSTGAFLWRQAKRETGGGPVYTDRNLDHTVTVETKKATKKKPAEYGQEERYAVAEKKKLAATFKPLVDALGKKFGQVVWWHYDHPTGTLLYGRGGNERSQALETDIRKIADQCFEKFTKALSTIHDKDIVPGR